MEGLVQSCPACGRKNRLRPERLAGDARCGACGAVLPPPAEPVAVDDHETLANLLATSALPVVVDFWAPWCGPCRMVAPELAKVAARRAGEILVVKTNTDVDPRVGATHRIQSIPTMAVWVGGRERERSSGARPAAAIEQLVDGALRSG